ncbi:fimbrial protein [Photobacterium profundum]|uniref:fimbrial protein n=1 Tax=Photobacterium profundum TaxID=74109 RepID=UPI003D0B62D7
MNKKVLSAAALLVMSVTNVAHAESVTAGNGQRGTVNFTGAITAQTCDTGIIVDGNDVAFVELPVITTSDFLESTTASESSETAVEFGLAPLNPDECPATTAALSLTGETDSKFENVLVNTLDKTKSVKTGVGVQVLFSSKAPLLNLGYQDAGDNFDEATKAVKLSANYFKTTSAANAGLVSAVASYQIAYL